MLKEKLLSSKAGILAALLSAGSIVGCAVPTEVIVFVDTTYGVPCQLDKMVMTIEGEVNETVEFDPREGQQSVTINKTSGSQFTVRLEGMKAGQVVSTATANAAFIDRTRQTVSMVLSTDCEENACDFTNFVDEVAAVTQPGEQTRLSCDGIANRYGFRDQTGLLEIVNACDQLAAAPFEAFTSVSNDEIEISAERLVNKFEDGFDFFYYGEKVRTLWVSDDGFLHFGENPTNATFDRVTNTEGITSAGHPKNAILPFWDNINLQAGGQICVGLQEGARDVLWVTWDNACLGPACAATDNMSFSVGLEEESQRIIVGYNDMNSATESDRANGGNAVVGITGPGEEGCDVSECDAEGLCADGQTPCNFTQVFSRTSQTTDWPAIYIFDPIADQ